MPRAGNNFNVAVFKAGRAGLARAPKKLSFCDGALNCVCVIFSLMPEPEAFASCISERHDLSLCAFGQFPR